MVAILVDMDADLLARAQVALGTMTIEETVTAALRFAVDALGDRRERALESLQRTADAGGFDFDRLEELDR